MMPSPDKCEHDRKYKFRDHYPKRDEKGEYDLCPQCGLLWRIGTNDPPFLMIGYYPRQRWELQLEGKR